jgi:hypothetical protein
MPALAFLPLLKKLWWSIPIALLLIALLVTRHTLANTKAERDQWHDKFSQEKAQFAIEKESLDGARAEINANNARIAAAGAELQREKQEAAANEAALNERYKAVGASVKRLEASAGNRSLPPCRVSQEALNALGGL